MPSERQKWARTRFQLLGQVCRSLGLILTIKNRNLAKDFGYIRDDLDAAEYHLLSARKKLLRAKNYDYHQALKEK